MADYDSDSSGVEDIETGVTLGYASKEATGDDFSQIGGHPVRQSPLLCKNIDIVTDLRCSRGLTTIAFRQAPWPNVKFATDI